MFSALVRRIPKLNALQTRIERYLGSVREIA